MNHRDVIAAVLMVAAVGGAGGLVGCSQTSSTSDEPVVTRGPAPSYIDAVTAYNVARPKIDRLRAPAVVRLTYADEDGKIRTEQGDGLLQVVVPDRVALSLRKVGTPILWLGCDEERSWFFDLISDEPTAVVRTNAELQHGGGSVGDDAGQLALGFRPSDLLVMIGLTTLDIHAEGATQWSADGRRLGITTRLSERAILRLWVDPATQRAEKAEWFDAQQRPLLIAEMTGQEPVEHTGAGARPMIPARLSVSHPATETYIRLDLSSGQSGDLARISDDAFRFEALRAYLGVDKVSDGE